MTNLDDKITEIYCNVDEFCKAFDNFLHTRSIGKRPKKEPKLSKSEICTILILYHLSGMKCFKYFYLKVVLEGSLRNDFRQALTYNRFLELVPRSLMYLYGFMEMRCCISEEGIYYIDSKKITVCHNRRIHSHKVFMGLAQRGHCSVGYFFGFKLFIVLDHIGRIRKFMITPANKADNNKNLLCGFLKGIKGKVFGDKGFINAAAWSELFENGLQIITKLRSNMKNKLINLEDKLFLSKRGVIESAFNLMITQCDLEHHRHRSPANAFCSMHAALIAYTFLETLPSILAKFADLLHA